MERIEVPRNPLGITVYAVGSPDIENMPDEEYDLFASSLELRINEYFNAPKEKKNGPFKMPMYRLTRIRQAHVRVAWADNGIVKGLYLRTALQPKTQWTT